MFKLNAERALARHIAGGGPAAPGSRGRPGDANFSFKSNFSFLGSLRSVTAAIGKLLSNALEVLLDWQERSRQRHTLMGLDDHMLRDIGLSRSDAEAEYRKPPWRV